jgi:hypothetical protein
MNNLLAVILFALIASINAKINTTNVPETSYLFSYFDNDEKAGLRIAYSTDGQDCHLFLHQNWRQNIKGGTKGYISI